MAENANETTLDSNDTKTEDSVNISQNSYDLVQYVSNAFSFSRPSHLRMIARLFGLDAPKVTKARVLELGCASGGNIIPSAMLFPEAKFVGIDLSKIQIDEGKKIINDLGLKNIRLEHKSISDVDVNFGEFDYIICHGVFSWVPNSVQWDIIRVCKENLSKNGVAYVSYNVLPGWGIVSAIRDMMIYHTSHFSNPQEKVSQAISILKFALENQFGENNHWKIAIENELNTLINHDISYLFHEHLEADNHPVYFYQFVEMAGRGGLRYLGDTLLSSMYVGNMPVKVIEALKILTDQVRQEQYMDFLINRRFRQTLLCHGSNKLNFAVSPEKILEFHLSLNPDIKPDFNPGLEDWTKQVPRSFFNGSITANDTIMAMALVVLGERNGHVISAKELITETTQRLGWKSELAVHAVFGGSALELAMRGIVFIHDGPEQCVRTISEKPEVWSYARYRVSHGNHLVNVKLESHVANFVISEFAKLLDGTRTKEEAIDELKKNLKKMDIEIRDNDGHVVSEEASIDKYIEQAANEHLNYFLTKSFLVS
ncbi:MAG: class I SAM-dependent methyltransferase [Puniceicoccales bacterium]|jgi:methyltransferase-like protein/ubiquinone/menaquinone biosynthesis C-methylase UbiE|nr:class I SAM-dependent methyltransferase [Puniceicoccales bacterium]